MGGKSKPKMEVAEYRLSIHMGIAHKVDKIHALYIDEKKFWSGEITSNTVININQPNLFGGNKEEGGLAGEIHVLMGADGQTLSPWLANKLTGQPGVPGFRGITSLFFTGFQGGRRGFYWTANQPYIKPISVTVSYTPVGLNPSYAAFPDGTVNPAHVIYEAMTDPQLGMGTPTYLFDLPTWNAAAQTLWNEGMGVSLAWVNQSSIEQIVKDLQDLIDGWVFQHPRTGLWTLRLVRGGYDVNTLRTITPDDAIFSNFQRKGLGETVNEIVVTWTNPENEQEETVTVHDNGNLAAQGSIVSDSRNYYAVRSAELAAKLAQRDIRVASAPLCACDVVLNRKFWDLVPGDVVKVTWPDYGLNELVMRVGKVDYGMPGDQAIKVNLVEDVFAIPAGSYVSPPSSGWVDPSEPPAPIPANLQHVVTLPSYFLANLMDASSIEDPEVRAGVLVTQTGQDTFAYNLLSYLANAGGTQEWTYIDQLPTLGYAPLPVALEREATSTIADLNPIYGSTYPKVGAFIWIGEPENFDEAAGDGAFRRAELCLITGYGAQGWTVMRGVLDTQPLDWPQGTPFWIIDPDVTMDDLGTIRSAGELARYKALPQTSQGVLDEAQAVQFTGTLTARPYFPARPANVRVNGVPWGPEIIGFGLDAVFTWSNRNRLTETSQILPWDAASIAPEDGQETVVEIFESEPKADSSYKARKISTGQTLTFTNDEIVDAVPTGDVAWSMYSIRDGKASFSRVWGRFTLDMGAVVKFIRASDHVFETAISLSVTLPSLDDVVVSASALFMVVMHRDKLTPPPGWELVVTGYSSTAPSTDYVQRTSIYQKTDLSIEDSGAVSTWVQETSRLIYLQALLFECSDSSEGVSVAEKGDRSDNGSSATVAVPVLTTTMSGECFLMAASYVVSSSSVSRTITPPANSTLVSPASMTSNRLGIAYRNAAQPGVSSSGSFTTSNIGGSYGNAITVRLQPTKQIVPAVQFVRAAAQVNSQTTSLTVTLPMLEDVVLSAAALFMVVMHREPLIPPPGWELVVSVQGLLDPGQQFTSIYRKSELSIEDSLASSTWQQESGSSLRLYLQPVLFESNDPTKMIAVADTGTHANTSTGETIAVPVLATSTDGEGFLMAASYSSARSSQTTTITPPSGSKLVSPATVSDNRLGVAWLAAPTAGMSNSGNFVSNATGGYASAVTVRLQLISDDGGYGMNYGGSYG
jgi:hypothetical protein